MRAPTLVLALVIGSTAAAQVRPRVILMVDTSGSMTEDFSGNDTGADGSSSYSDNLISKPLYPGYSQASTCPAGAPYLGTNSRIYAVKSAVSAAVDGSGDVDWGLMRYSGTQCAQVDTQTTAFGAGSDSCYVASNCKGGGGGSDGCLDNICECTSNGAGACRSGRCLSLGNGHSVCGCNANGDCSSASCNTTTHLCNCNSDDQCIPGAFCNTTTHQCFYDDNLCSPVAYGETDKRQPLFACARHPDLPLTYAGDCGNSTTTGAACTTLQTCAQDSDCGPAGPINSAGGGSAGQCAQLGSGPVHVCSCTDDTQCPLAGATRMATCQFITGTSGPKACKYAQPCTSGGAVVGGAVVGGGGVILVDPASPSATSIVSYLDGAESLVAGSLNPELRAIGPTPLAGAARTAAVWYANIGSTAADAALSCRPYVLVQITDGADTCENGDDGSGGRSYNQYGAVAAAQAFVAATQPGARVTNKVYVIGLAADPATQTELDAIARAGGTGSAYLANSQQDIEAALSKIVAANALVERCNYIDDDCNGVADEPFPDVGAGATCTSVAAGHCAAAGKLRCAADQLGEACGPSACRHGAGSALTKIGSAMTLAGVSGFGAADIGQTITIVAARNAANQGSFTITAQTGTTVTFTNANGVAESDSVGYEIYCAQQFACRSGSGTALTTAGSSETLAGVSTVTAADLGSAITITSAANPANRGTFEITSRTANSVTFLNPNGVSETGAVGWQLDCASPSCRRATGASLSAPAGGNQTLSGVSGFGAGDVGATITIAAAANGGNRGNFVITGVTASSVTFANPKGAAESGDVGWNIYCVNAEEQGGCNSFDDDCNGVVDDCTTGVAGSCCASAGCAAYETCNGLDDDCNGLIDDNPVDVGGACGDNTGDCAAGTWACCTSAAGTTCPGHQAGDVRVCLGGNPGYPKPADLCDGTDDNCDGVVNGDVRQACYTSAGGATLLTPAQAGVGICRAGTAACNTAALPAGSCGFPAGKPCPNPTPSFGACAGAVGPAPEVCNGIDDDCDGITDDNVADPWVGTACCSTGNLADCTNSGTGTRCQTGHYACVAGAKSCVGSVARAPEICDGNDNDCNGIADDVVGIGVPCAANGANNVGACRAAFACISSAAGDCDGQPCPNGLTCVASVAPSPERCNGIDDDCDGLVDEPAEVAANDPTIGVACDAPVAPADQPPCKPGTSACVAGKAVCLGAVHPSPNVCGGVSTDCTGQPAGDGSCPAGSTCYQGQCDPPCSSSDPPCPGGYRCDATQNLCVPDGCAAAGCAAGQICALGDGGASCVDPCSTVVCPSGYACAEGACRATAAPHGGCSCDVGAGGGAPPWPAALVVLVLALARLRRRREVA